jgi:DinB superfamily
VDAVELLAVELDEAYRMIRDRVDGLDDAEFWWEPAPDCWTIRQRPDGRWAADYAVPDPEPAPVTTIGWRLVHVGECKIMYHEYAFGAGKLTWPEIDSAHDASAAIAQLEEGHALLVADLHALASDALERPVLTNWGEEWPAWRVFWTMIHHDVHHGAEIGALRDLYRANDVALHGRGRAS